MIDIDTKQIEEKALAIPNQAKALTVIDNKTMETANSFKITIKTMIKEVDSFFEPFEKQAFQMHRALTSKHKEINTPLLEADQYITGQVKVYLKKVEEKRQAEEIRLRDIARKEEEERRLMEAIELEKEGNVEEAQAVISEPMNIVTPTVKMDIPKVDGRLYRTVWKWKIVDMAKIPREFLTTDDIKINGVVRALKGATSISGVAVYEE